MIHNFWEFHGYSTNFTHAIGYDPVISQSAVCGPKLVLRTEYFPGPLLVVILSAGC